MARVKFLVFALVVLGLWGSHLFLLSPSLGKEAVRAAQDRAAAAPHALVVGLQQRHAELKGAALALLNAPGASPAAGQKATAERLAELRTVAQAGLPEDARGALLLALVNESGAVAARGSESIDVGTLDLKALAAAGLAGLTVEVGDALHHVHSVSLNGTTAIVAGPVFSPELLERAVAATGVPVMGLMRDGKVVQLAGAQRGWLGEVAASVKPGAPSVVVRGERGKAGSFQLPIATDGDLMGGAAATFVGARTAVPQMPLEVVTLVSLSGFNAALSGYQTLALGLLGALLLLTLVFLVLFRSPAAAASSAASAQPAAKAPESPAPARTVTPAPMAAASESPSEPVYAPSPVSASLPELPPAPEGIPDDFPFGTPSNPAAAAPPNAFEAETRQVPQSEMPFDPPQDPWSQPSADPFAQAAAQGGIYSDGEGLGDSPEATRVAAVPAELLQQASRAADPELAAANPGYGWAGQPAASAEDAHFLEVYQAFIQTRQQCGEPADGLTWDKFAQKLRKNREQLTAKYQCRTVRFQVYVKEGKAALKATPIKD